MSFNSLIISFLIEEIISELCLETNWIEVFSLTLYHQFYLMDKIIFTNEQQLLLAVKKYLEYRNHYQHPLGGLFRNYRRGRQAA